MLCWSNCKPYERMKISTCVTPKLNQTFIWAASRPPILFVIVLWLFEFCWKLKMIVNHTKWCPAKSLHGTMIHILRTLIALVEGFPFLNPNTSANLSSAPNQGIKWSSLCRVLKYPWIWKKAGPDVRLVSFSDFLLRTRDNSLWVFRELGREREINLCHLGSKQRVLWLFSTALIKPLAKSNLGRRDFLWLRFSYHSQSFKDVRVRTQGRNLEPGGRNWSSHLGGARLLSLFICFLSYLPRNWTTHGGLDCLMSAIS